MPIERLKRDHFGSISLIDDGEQRRIIRNTGDASPFLRGIARWVARREAKAMRRLEGLAGVPVFLRNEANVFERSFLDGATMRDAKPRHAEYFHHAARLLRQMHRHGVAHNDLAKEENWLVLQNGEPAVVDFQLAWLGNPESRWFRLLAFEDLRHLLKHKRTYCAERLTAVEKRVLARRSWLSRLWRASGKKVYILVARKIMRWEDNEGRARKNVE